LGQPIRGLNYPGGIRPTLIILDDPEDENNTKTIEAMDNNFNWLLQGALPALDVKIGRIIVIGTPLHQKCIVEKLKGHEGFTTLWKQYLYEADSTEYSLWPEMMSVDDLYDERSNLEKIGKLSAFYRERMCVIVGDEERLFKEEYFMYYDGHVEWDNNGKAFLHRTKVWANGQLEPEELTGDDIERIPVSLYMGIDPATSTSKAADFFAIVTIAVDKEGNRYVLPYYRKRVTPTEAINAILEEYDKYKPIKVSIETVQAQETFRDILRNLEGIYIPGLGIKHNYKESKANRYKEEVEGLEPYFYKKKYYFLKNQTALRDELVGFPNATAHDDLIDGLYLASKNVSKPSHGLIETIIKSPYYRQKPLHSDPLTV
jgi:predicted phage terminase large subunit-like protein